MFVLFQKAVWVVAVDVAFENLFDCLNLSSLVYPKQSPFVGHVVWVNDAGRAKIEAKAAHALLGIQTKNLFLIRKKVAAQGFDFDQNSVLMVEANNVRRFC